MSESVRLTRWHRSSEALEAAARWRDRCLLADGSVLSSKSLWNCDNLDHLQRHFVENLDMGEGDFFQKLKSQLSPAPASAKQLAAEMLWLLFLFISSTGMKAATKRLHIEKVWEWSGEPLPNAEFELGDALEQGIGNTGTAYSTQRWRELVFLITAMRMWKAMSSVDHGRLLGDPWSFAQWIESVPEGTRRQLRHILPYLLYPDVFERISTTTDKKRLVRAFREEAGLNGDDFDYKSPLALDREILRIRESLTASIAQPFDFYHDPLVRRWKPDHTVNNADERLDEPAFDNLYRDTFGDHRVWVIATGEGGRMWPEFLREGYVGVDTELGDLTEIETREAVHAATSALPGSAADPRNDSLAYWQFAHEMRSGDYVIAKRGTTEVLGEGRIESDYEYRPDVAEYQHRRRVKWGATGQWDLGKQGVVQKTLTDFSEKRDWLHRVWTMMHTAELVRQRSRVAENSDHTYTLNDALEGLFLSQDRFRSILDALARKKSIIIEGPPGVGKTFIAKRLAYALIGHRDANRVEMVQFHQSYAYEDFMQGWRPDGRGAFKLQHGAFYRFCKRAERDPQSPHVFIIDEINRGNLSKVFGELLLLIEADKRGPEHAIQLTYSTTDEERFSVPENVHIIGLMNTADRSLAMVDYALRRRFSFVRLEPAFDTEHFSEHLLDAEVSESLVTLIVERLTALNDTIREDRTNLGPGFVIGHSFFVPPKGAERLDNAWYESVVRSEIEPLLAEYWFDQPDRVREQVDRLLR